MWRGEVGNFNVRRDCPHGFHAIAFVVVADTKIVGVHVFVNVTAAGPLMSRRCYSSIRYCSHAESGAVSFFGRGSRTLVKVLEEFRGTGACISQYRHRRAVFACGFLVVWGEIDYFLRGTIFGRYYLVRPY